MSTFLVYIAGSIVLIAAIFAVFKARSATNKLKKLEDKIEYAQSFSKEARQQLQSEFKSDLTGIKARAIGITNDPLMNDLINAFKTKSKLFIWIFVKLLESSQILLGVSAGLLGMSLVAVIFHFIRNVVNLDTSQVLESVSYTVFFVAVSIGILANGYLQRKISRLQNQHLTAEISFQDQLEHLKQSYEELLVKNEDEKNSIVSGKESIISELNAIADNRQKIIAALEKQQITKRFSFKKFSALNRRK